MDISNVIFIDDRPGFFSGATISNILRRANDNHQIQINLIPLNPKDQKYVNEDGVIRPEKIIEALDSPQYLRQDIQLIACDYDFGGDVINGFEIVRMLRNNLESKKKIILYSSNIENVINNILEGSQNGIIEKITDLINSNISAFCKRDSHLEEAMIKYLKEEAVFSADKAFEAELYKYRDFKFKSSYRKFENMTLGEVADIISKNKNEANLLKKELIEQVVAYMVVMENE